MYGCSGLDNILLNHNHYIKAKNVCSAQCSIYTACDVAADQVIFLIIFHLVVGRLYLNFLREKCNQSRYMPVNLFFMD